MGVWLTVLKFSSVVFFNKSKCCSFDFIVNINSILNTNQSFFAKRNICYQRNTHHFLGVFLVNLKQNYWVLNVKKISSSYKTLLLIRENLEYFYKPIILLTKASSIYTSRSFKSNQCYLVLWHCFSVFSRPIQHCLFYNGHFSQRFFK